MNTIVSSDVNRKVIFCMKIDKSKLKAASIQNIENDLKKIQKEFDNDTLMQPMSYARMKELTAYRKTLQEELVERKQKIGDVYEHECNDYYTG